MPDVILVYPRTLWDIKNVTTRLPLAALYIGSLMQEQGFTVQVIDQRTDERWSETLRDALDGPSPQEPLWVGISAMTGRQIHWGLEAAEIVRSARPETPIVWGGVHPTILPDQTLAHPLVDLVAVGEGEQTALELSQRLRSGDREDLGEIAGLIWSRSTPEGANQVMHNDPRHYTPMDELPLLDYSLVDVEQYILAEVPGDLGRLAGADVADQKRVATPGEAVRDGATHLVVGRPILQADDPRAAAETILEQMSPGVL